MIRYIMILLLLCSGYASAHQWTPTYPVLRSSHLTNIYTTTMELFNTRKDVEYYGVEVFDAKFVPVPFATGTRIIKLPYLGRTSVEVYIRGEDKPNAVYICSISKLLAKGSATTSISSRICSKIK